MELESRYKSCKKQLPLYEEYNADGMMYPSHKPIKLLSCSQLKSHDIKTEVLWLLVHAC